MNIFRKLFRSSETDAQDTYMPNTRQPCPHCGRNDWSETPIYKQELVNPNGEFVEGYGHSLVFRTSRVDTEYRCISCGWLEGGNSTIIRMDDDTGTE